MLPRAGTFGPIVSFYYLSSQGACPADRL